VKSIERQTKLSKRPAELAKALKNTLLVLAENMNTAIRLANSYASEHVSIATEAPGEIAMQLQSSGAIFLGAMSPVAAGDFLAGPSHELPTGGAGHSFAGLTADQFQRRTSVVMFDKKSLSASLPFIEKFSEIEGLDAHGRSAAIRLGKK
jgi:histidinol dehydrogenase